MKEKMCFAVPCLFGLESFVKEGDTVKAKIISIDQSGKISLSMKQLQEDKRPPRKERPQRKYVFSGRPENVDWGNKSTELSFEEMMSKFKTRSEEKISDLKRNVDGKRGRIDLRIPTLEDYLRICKKYDKYCILEFKGYFSVENMEKVVEIVKAEYTLDKMIFISFSFENLLNLRKVCPESHCQFLTGEFKDEIIDMLKEHKMGIDIWSNALDEEWKVKKLLDEGIEVNVWTVDNKELAEKLISWGVQYVTSNILE